MVIVDLLFMAAFVGGYPYYYRWNERRLTEKKLKEITDKNKDITVADTILIG